jgi:hypothetical protein
LLAFGGAAIEVAAGALGFAAAVLFVVAPVGFELVQAAKGAMRTKPASAIAAVLCFMETSFTS